MTASIAKTIIKYTGDYELPKERHKRQEIALFLNSERVKVEGLLRRFALEREVGSYSIQQKDDLGRPAGKELTAVVTLSSEAWEKQLFTAWLDNGKSTCCLGEMRINLFTTDNGRVCSPSNPYGISEMSPIFKYASQAAGCVFIENLDAHARAEFRGIGSGLIQLAAEVSLNAGCDGCLLLTASKNSKGFYEKVDFTTGSTEAGGIVREGYENTTMKLDLEARLKYRQIIARQPILREPGAGAPAAKEERKSS